MCSCSQFSDLEFFRDAIGERIKLSRPLKKALVLIDDEPSGEHKLYRCNRCGQLWQSSRAWNWGNHEYLFKVPLIEAVDWKATVYVQPDELLIFAALIGHFLTSNDFETSVTDCRTQGCQHRAVSGSVNCKRHHLESLQRIGTMPPYPTGRWFGPYVAENIIPAM